MVKAAALDLSTLKSGALLHLEQGKDVQLVTNVVWRPAGCQTEGINTFEPLPGIDAAKALFIAVSNQSQMNDHLLFQPPITNRESLSTATAKLSRGAGIGGTCTF